MTFEPGELTPDRSARHFYGAELRRHRMNADTSLGSLASVVPCSKSQLARIETAESMPPPGLSEEFDRVFQTDGHFTRLYGLVSKEIHPEQYRRRMELEARSRIIREFAGLIVPGLLQTRQYAHCVTRTVMPRAAEQEVQQIVDARMTRQELLRAPSPPDYSVILDEACLRRPIGGAAMMRAQLEALIDVVAAPCTVVQVLPFSHGQHALLGGTLTLMTLAEGGQVAYEESISTGTLIENPERVNELSGAYDRLRSHALPPSDTARFIRSVMEALSHEQPP